MDQVLKKYFSKFSSLRVAVIGDFIADEFIYGETSRISREAPVIVLDFQDRSLIPGGGGNAAMNASSLGSKVFAVGVVGNDMEGQELKNKMFSNKINVDQIILDSETITPTKKRILAGGRNTTRQQVIRVDNEKKRDFSEKMESQIIQSIENLYEEGLDAIIVSDYGLGVVTEKIRKFIEKISNEIIVTVDSRWSCLAFKGLTAITPNEEEVEDAIGFYPNDENLDQAGKELMKITNSKAVLITRGKKGMSVFEKGKIRTDVPIFGSDQVADVTGAGDTVIAAFTLSLASGASLKESTEIASIAAGLVVMKMGTAVVKVDELIHALEG
mgnify:FL=1|tara:strand:+ start:54209 stop:55192 length:984 start_codon:yes stop_codon:yes gene_type:complete